MEGYTTARRYPTRPMRPYRRHRRNARQNRLGRLLAVQTLICVILLLAVITAKCLNIAVAGYITGKVRYVLEHDVELKNIYAYAEALVSDVKSSIAKGGKNSDGDIRAESGGSLGKTAVLSAELVMPDMTGAYSGRPVLMMIMMLMMGCGLATAFRVRTAFLITKQRRMDRMDMKVPMTRLQLMGEMFCSNTMRKIFYSNMRWKLASCQQAAGAAMTRRKVRRPAWKDRGIMA